MRRVRNIRVKDAETNEALAEIRDAIAELQNLPIIGLRVIRGIELADGVATPIAHVLGRRYQAHACSSPRGASATGRIVETRSSEHDPSKFIVLTATDWGATITVDVWVV